jgi:hypothetical protein
MNKLILSGLCSIICSIIYLLIAGLLDNVFSSIISNTIGLVIGCMLNYMLQCYTFSEKKERFPFSTVTCMRFFMVDLCVIILSSTLFYLVKQYGIGFISDTLNRVVISSIGFMILSYPLRKYYVFSLM